MIWIEYCDTVALGWVKIQNLLSELIIIWRSNLVMRFFLFEGREEKWESRTPPVAKLTLSQWWCSSGSSRTWLWLKDTESLLSQLELLQLPYVTLWNIFHQYVTRPKIWRFWISDFITRPKICETVTFFYNKYSWDQIRDACDDDDDESLTVSEAMKKGSNDYEWGNWDKYNRPALTNTVDQMW